MNECHRVRLAYAICFCWNFYCNKPDLISYSIFHLPCLGLVPYRYLPQPLCYLISKAEVSSSNQHLTVKEFPARKA